MGADGRWAICFASCSLQVSRQTSPGPTGLCHGGIPPYRLTAMGPQKTNFPNGTMMIKQIGGRADALDWADWNLADWPHCCLLRNSELRRKTWAMSVDAVAIVRRTVSHHPCLVGGRPLAPGRVRRQPPRLTHSRALPACRVRFCAVWRLKNFNTTSWLTRPCK